METNTSATLDQLLDEYDRISTKLAEAMDEVDDAEANLEYIAYLYGSVTDLYPDEIPAAKRRLRNARRRQKALSDKLADIEVRMFFAN